MDQEDDEMPILQLDVVDGQQLMEVLSQVENSCNLETPPTEDPALSRYLWKIKNFSRLNTRKHYSEIFVVGGYKWHILIFPKGNNVEHLSMYLDIADLETLPYGWSKYAQFSLSVVNQIHYKYTVRKVLFGVHQWADM